MPASLLTRICCKQCCRLLLLPPFSALSGQALLQVLQLDVNTSVCVRSLCALNQLIVEGGILLVHKRSVDVPKLAMCHLTLICIRVCHVNVEECIFS